MSRHSRLAVVSLGLSLLALSCATKEAPSLIPPPGADSASVAGAHDDDDDFDLDEPEPVQIPTVDGDATVQAIVNLGHTDNHVTDHLRHLTETIGPRLTGSHALMDAERWCADQLSSWGLVSRLERWGEMPVGFDRGPWSGGMVAPERVDYDFITPAWTPGVLDPTPGPAVAYPRSVKQAKARRSEFEGAWVVRPRGLDLPRKTITAINDALAQAGAAGIVRADRDEQGKLVHTFGRPKIEWGQLPDLVTVILRNDQHADLLARLQADTAVQLSFTIDNRFFRGPVPQHNVVAELRGTEKPEEFVIVGGHLDSWDGATGANDNGTGVATTMEAARLLVAAGAKPKRTIRFILWTGEEQGLLGSRGDVELHPEQMDSISAVFVHDMGTNYLSGVGVTPEMMPQMKKIFAPIQQLSPEEMPFELRTVEGLQPGGSDHSPYIRAGVPGFFWDQAGESDYWPLHHTQLDTIDNVIEPYQRHSAMVVALTAWQVANQPELVERTNSSPLPRRRFGVQFGEGFALSEISKDGVAAAAGWKSGDVIVSIEGQTYEDRREMVRAVQGGSATQSAVIERKGKRITTTLDWSDAKGEQERARRRKVRGAAP